MPVPDRQKDRQTDEHHGNSVTIHSMNALHAKIGAGFETQ